MTEDSFSLPDGYAALTREVCAGIKPGSLAITDGELVYLVDERYVLSILSDRLGRTVSEEYVPLAVAHFAGFFDSPRNPVALNVPGYGKAPECPSVWGIGTKGYSPAFAIKLPDSRALARFELGGTPAKVLIKVADGVNEDQRPLVESGLLAYYGFLNHNLPEQ